MKAGLMQFGMLAVVWENLSDDARAPHSSILDIFARYISRGDDEADAFLTYLIESNLHSHVSTEARAVWVAERIGEDEMPTDATKLKAA